MVTRFSLAAVLCLAVLAAPPPALALGTVYRCETDGRTEFSQFPCTAGARGQPLPVPPAIHSTPLSDAERRRLDALGRALEREREALRRSRNRAAAASLRAQRRQEQRCAQARRALERLARLRRGGYSLSEAARLDAREAELEAEVRSRC